MPVVSLGGGDFSLFVDEKEGQANVVKGDEFSIPPIITPQTYYDMERG